MSYKMTDNTEEINSVVRNRAGLAVRLMLDAIHRESTPKTPMSADPKTRGQLRADIRKTVNGTKGRIHWGKKYAWYQERGYTSGPVKRYTTAGTGKHFARNAIDKVQRDKQKYFKMAGLV